jgi:hypothetical protein
MSKTRRDHKGRKARFSPKRGCKNREKPSLKEQESGKNIRLLAVPGNGVGERNIAEDGPRALSSGKPMRRGDRESRQRHRQLNNPPSSIPT